MRQSATYPDGPGGDLTRTVGGAIDPLPGVTTRREGTPMGKYETEPGVDPVRITTIRRMRRRWKHGEQPADEPGLFDDLFTATTQQR
jgi:hypothetical protein